MARKAVTRAEAATALATVAALPTGPDGGVIVDRSQVRELVRTTLVYFGQLHPGRSVEVRVPPHSAIQAIEGIRHTRGTPPNVIEMDGPTWLSLCTGRLNWSEVIGTAGTTGVGRLRASGTRADLSQYLPIEA